MYSRVRLLLPSESFLAVSWLFHLRSVCCLEAVQVAPTMCVTFVPVVRPPVISRGQCRPVVRLSDRLKHVVRSIVLAQRVVCVCLEEARVTVSP